MAKRHELKQNVAAHDPSEHNDLNGAKRWNVWNGPHELVSEALELFERLEHLKPNQSDNVLNEAKRLNALNELNRPPY